MSLGTTNASSAIGISETALLKEVATRASDIIGKTIFVRGLTDFLYQRDGEIIAFARPDLAVAGTGLSSAAPAVGIETMNAA